MPFWYLPISVRLLQLNLYGIMNLVTMETDILTGMLY